MEGENAMSLCDKCKHYDSCELGLIVYNPMQFACVQKEKDGVYYAPNFHISPTGYMIHKGDKIAQCTLMEHKGYLLGIESHAERSGGFGSSGK